MGVFEELKKVPSTSSSGGGVFATIKNTNDTNDKKSIVQGQKKFGTVSLDPSQSPVMQQASAFNTANPPEPSNYDARKNDPSRNIPVLGGVFKMLDKLSDTKTQHVIADVGQSLYTPGGSAANVAGLFGAAEQGIAKLAPKLAPIAQKTIAGAATGFPTGVGQYQAMGGDNTGEAVKQGVFGALLGGAGSAAGSAVSKSFDKLFSKVKPIESAPITQSGPVLGLPEPKSAIMAREAQNRSVLQPNTDVIHGQGNVETLGLPQGQYTKPTKLKVSGANDTLDYVMRKIKPEVEAKLSGIHENTAEARAQLDDVTSQIDNMKSAYQSELTKNYDYLKNSMSQRGGVSQGQLIKDSEGAVLSRVGRISDNPKWYQDFFKENGRTPTNKDLRELALKHTEEGHTIEAGNIPSWTKGNNYHESLSSLEQVKTQLSNSLDEINQKGIYDLASQAAAGHGHDLGALFEKQGGTFADIAKKFKSEAAYGFPAEKVNIAKPNFNVTHNADAAMPITKVGRASTQRQTIDEFINAPKQEVAATTEVKPKVEPVKGTVTKNETVQPRTTTELPDTKIKGQQLKDLRTGDQVKFADTVKNSEQTSPEQLKAMEDRPITGARTTDVLNRQEANKLITKHGEEGLYSKLMSKRGSYDNYETTAAIILSKKLISKGGEDNMSKGLDLLARTGKGGREHGQAIQALAQYNKLDQEGALLLGTRKLNEGVKDLKDYKTLSTQEAKPIITATERIGQATETKNLADEVLHIVTNKTEGEALTEAEKATIKQFQDQVKTINEKGKGILSKPKAEKVVNKSDETIKEVSQIEPKARTRDQVVSFLDAKAEKARKRLAASRNLGFAATTDKGNPVIDYAIIGASHIAKGVVKLSDFTEAMVRDFGESVKPHINDAFTRATNIFRKENGLPTVEQLDKAVNAAVKNERFTTEEANQFKAWASEIGHYADKNLKVEATQDLQKALNDIGTSTLGDKLSATQTATQLLSVPTLVRNVVGNEAFNLVEKINKVNAAPIDWALSKFTGERTVVFSAKNQEKYWDNFIKGLKGGWKGISPNGQFEAYDIHPNAFKSDKNPLKYLQKALGAELQSFDHAAYMRAYGRTLGEYAKITGKKVEDLDQAIFDLADEAGRYATFQDDTFLSKLATGTKRLLNKPTDLLADALVHKGVLPESLSWKGFGTGDLILKYAKTPANIVMRGIDYSPIGFMRGLGELIPLVTGKAFNQRAATMALSRGITGTLGMTAMGYALISAGILTGKSSDDADIRSLDQQTGKGEYKVNWDALSRYVKGGLDKKDAVWQKGDNITDWGWLQPMAISISMGVNAQQSVEKQKTEGVKSYVGVAKDALLGSLKTIMQQPLLSGVQNLVSGVTNVMRYGSWTGIANIFKGAPASFVPSGLNQVRNFTDNTSRNTYDPSALKEALNMVINKIPGLDKKLPIAYDTLGKPREQVQGSKPKTGEQALKTFASPVKLTKYQVTPEAKMIIDLINATGDEKVAPRTPNKYLMVNKKKIELTPAQYSEIQQKTGEATQQALAKLSTRLANPNLAEEAKVKLIIDTLNTVGDKVRTQLNKEYPELKPKTAYELKHSVK